MSDEEPSPKAFKDHPKVSSEIVIEVEEGTQETDENLATHSLAPDPEQSTQSGWNTLRVAVNAAPTVNHMQIRNRNSILTQLDRRLNEGNPPAMEFFFVEDAVNTKTVAGVSPFGFGHACVRYSLKQPDGTWKQKMVNIERGAAGTSQSDLIRFYDTTEDYVFGGVGEHAGKGGVFARNIASLRIERADEDQVFDSNIRTLLEFIMLPTQILAMDYFFQSMKHSHKAGVARFKITGGNWTRLLSYINPFHGRAILVGNCSVWTSRGLVNGGFLSKVI